jgi:putative ABC transport system ATP-binding protein
VIQIENISKRFRSGRGEVNALDIISFNIEESSTTVIAGKSGSGKTTLLNCIGGLDKPETGRVIIEGVDIHALSERALCLFQRSHLGFIFQHSNLLNYLSVFQNIAFPLELNGVEKNIIKDRVQTLLDMIDLSGLENAMPHELSGGEAQRVAFARASAHSPNDNADEPTASLDSETGMSLVKLMFSIGRQGCIMVIATLDTRSCALRISRFR